MREILEYRHIQKIEQDEVERPVDMNRETNMYIHTWTHTQKERERERNKK
jgi:hypothetical protein